MISKEELQKETHRDMSFVTEQNMRLEWGEKKPLKHKKRTCFNIRCILNELLKLFQLVQTLWSTVWRFLKKQSYHVIQQSHSWA